MDIDKDTRIIALFGNPVGHSISPAIHNAAFTRAGLNYIYIPFELKENQLERALNSFDCFRIEGANVTVPYKTDVIKYLDELDEKARLMGAVNVISYCDGKLKGYNTDGDGFLMSLKENAGITPEGHTILILGGGGAARAIAFSLAIHRAKRVYIANRTYERAAKLSEEINRAAKGAAVPIHFDYDSLKAVSYKADIIVNATTVGMSPHTDESPVPIKIIHSSQLVCDVVYNPIMTRLLREASDKGCDVLTGLGMFIYQAIESFKIWTGIEPDYDELYEIAYRKLADSDGKGL